MRSTPSEFRRAMEYLRKQKYHLIGGHSAVKKCYWVHKALVEHRFCYKAKFYGIESHRCAQFSPAVLWCWNRCLHCWRYRPGDRGIWSEVMMERVDDPRYIVDMVIDEHRRTVSGYKMFATVDRRMYEEARNPKHVAISLTGEATLYPMLDDLIREFHRRGMTTFLVTRGVRPEVVANLDEEPTQLYVSIEAYDEGSYAYFNNPLSPRLWRRTLELLELLPSFTCPTVIRITVVKSFNMNDRAIREWARILRIAEPTFIEVKAYMHIGGSIERLKRDDMPSHSEVREVAVKLADELSYNVASESKPSRVVLLTKLRGPIVRYGNPPISWSDPDYGDEYSGEYGELDKVV